ncbi:MAG: M61 family metallopeptidase [Planctomycetes bacterium]|nr:M61 family metallopeptidase [Planctomycetota bacterium]
MLRHRRFAFAFILLLFLSALPAPAQDAGRPMQIHLDASDVPRKLLHCRIVIPARPGPLTLYYPKWIPGEHSPSGPINDLSGLKISANGKPLAWRRDDVDLYAFHLTVPEGVDSIEASLDYLGQQAREAEGFSSGTCMTAQLGILNWSLVTLYPKGLPPREQKVQAHVKVPQGWKFGTALPIDWQKDGEAQFKTVSLEMLIDSPVLCGAHFREIPIGPKDGPPHFLVLACDSAAGLEIDDDLKSQYDRLVVQAGELFGSRHYRSYRFLLAMSDHIRHDAVEHHECSDNRVPERFLVDEDYRTHASAWMLPHEFVHSWNGKFRRPAGLTTPDYQQPMKTRDLWFYEGLTQYLGFVLTGRSGLYTPDLMQENFALIADWARNQRGRTWRPLEDTTGGAPTLYYARTEWGSRRRGVDFYDEGALLWLDVDTLIREKSGGKKSFDDFCRAFFGGNGSIPDGTSPAVKTYTFDDVVRTLNDVVAHDWKSFLHERLTSTDLEPPLEGLKRGGWKVVYETSPSELLKARESEDKNINLTASIGLKLREDGGVIDIIPGSAADKAGIGPGMKLLAIRDRRWTADRLKEAVAGTSKAKDKLTLMFENQEYFRTFVLDYNGGARYPHLERDEGGADVFGAIFGAVKRTQ